MIKRRVIQVLELKGIAKELFYKKIGVSSANFRGKTANTALGSNIIENIIAEIPDINLEWLITGKGEMLIKDNNRPDISDVELLNDYEMTNQKLVSMLYDSQAEVKALKQKNAELREQLKSASGSGTDKKESKAEGF